MFYFGWWDLIPIPGFLLALYAQFKLRGLYAKYHDVPQSRGLTGAEVAQAILDRAGISDVAIEPCPGELTDHYDPKNRVLRLSEPNFQASSISAIGVAAHEAGHAIQHKEKYAPLEMRMSIVGVTNFATSAGMILFFAGLLIHSGLLLQIGIWCYSAIVVFQLITLPVEYDASRRAKLVLAELGLVDREEGEAIRKVLGAAALTYVAALAVALLQLVKMIALANTARDRD
jgi:Zn-dependent membrane protease YugP